MYIYIFICIYIYINGQIITTSPFSLTEIMGRLWGLIPHSSPCIKATWQDMINISWQDL